MNSDSKSKEPEDMTATSVQQNEEKSSEKYSDDLKPLSKNNKPSCETAKTQFNKNRKVIIRNVPPVTYEVNL